ncbi:50S ribosomal protein L6 [Escherichia coli]|uniref:50S ribosomal protein L6 n=1 Tax=Escherichia coli TaxID=562 RepID=A0A376RBS1_ECOLX|nr:50S ribosomal protein L6 [Escherichia coli]
MSRVAKAPVVVPAGVDVKINGQVITIKGKNGELTRTLTMLLKLNMQIIP